MTLTNAERDALIELLKTIAAKSFKAIVCRRALRGGKLAIRIARRRGWCAAKH